jgi:uncharacterized membrane protein YfhO
MVLIHSDTPLLVIVLQNHFNIGSRYGFLFLINCSTSFYNEPINKNEVKAHINLPSSKLIFISIPYSKGWDAFLNGKQVNILKANIAFMAIPAEAGEYELKLKYRTPYLLEGLSITIISLIIVYILYYFKYRINNI